MKAGKMSKRMKMLVKGMAVAGLICLPIFGSGKSEASDVSVKKGSAVQNVLEQKVSEVQDIPEQNEAVDSEVKTVATPEQIDVNSILEGGTDKSDSNNSSQGGASDAVEAGDGVDAADGTEAADSEDSAVDASVDVDLTALSATMVYSEVFQMMYYPEDYIGKTVKMEGLYDHYHDDATGKDYYACIIQDATACCAQGIEFQLSDGEYPADATSDVMVKGTFETYEENGAKYCTLVDAELID